MSGQGVGDRNWLPAAQPCDGRNLLCLSKLLFFPLLNKDKNRLHLIVKTQKVLEQPSACGTERSACPVSLLLWAERRPTLLMDEKAGPGNRNAVRGPERKGSAPGLAEHRQRPFSLLKAHCFSRLGAEGYVENPRIT